jgi:hypothetical protein
MKKIDVNSSIKAAVLQRLKKKGRIFLSKSFGNRKIKEGADVNSSIKAFVNLKIKRKMSKE